jgi:hypothetical protein
LSTALQPDLPSQVAGSNLVSSSVQALQVARSFAQRPSDEGYEAIAGLLETQFAWLDLLNSAELMQAGVLAPHRERVLDLLADAFQRSP